MQSVVMPVASSKNVKPTADLEVGLMSAVKTLKGVTLALVGIGQSSSRMARRGVQRAKGRKKKGRRLMRKCILFFLMTGGCYFSGFEGGCSMEGDRKI